MEKKFDYENFDYETCFKEVENSIKKPNIMICGASGVGKSSLINDIMDLDKNSSGATVGEEGRAETKGVKRYESASSTVNLYDSEGYEVDNVNSQKDFYYKEIISFIDKLRDEYPEDMEKHIHEVWYCISAGNKRFYDTDRQLINTIQEKNVPVMIIVTKVDLSSEEELVQLRNEIHSQCPHVNCYTYSVNMKDAEEEQIERFVQKEQIIKWAMDNLDDSLKNGLLPSIKGGIKEKREYAIRKIIPPYAALAVGAVVGGAFSPIPFSDSLPLMGIQIKMTYDILKTFGIKTDMQKALVEVVGSQAISYMGKTIASQLVSIIPIFGGGVKIAVNTSVAVTVTATLGVTIALISEQYVKACVDAGGAVNLPFTEFLTKERLVDTLNYVKANKSLFALDDIINDAIKKSTKKNKKK